jgi:hypothetical protein
LAVLITLSASHERVKEQRPPGAPSRWQDFWGFATGALSLEDALARGDGLWAAAIEAKKQVGPGEKILCFNNGFSGIASHLFPGEGLITEPSRSCFEGKWQDIVFKGPEFAKAVLQKQNINYFLIDLGIRFFGCIPYSPLFEPDKLNERFDLVWMSGRTCLLTWKGQGPNARKDLPITFIWSMRDRVKNWRLAHESHPDFVFGSLYQNMKIIYDFNQPNDFPLKRPPELTRVKGFQ